MTHKYNTYFPDDATPDSLQADREKMLKSWFGALGANSFVEPPVILDYGCNLVVGEGFYANFNLVILDCSLITIGHRVLLGPCVSIYAATHETEVQSRRDGVEYADEVSIGDDCWIGGNVTIMPGVHIGKGVTVGAGSVVTKSIPDYCVAIGSPARVVKKVEPLEDMAGHLGGYQQNGAKWLEDLNAARELANGVPGLEDGLASMPEP